MSYEHFLTQKLAIRAPSGIASGFSLPGAMFPHQSALAAWALRRGRAAVFADTGLGKMLIELAWADAVNRYTRRPVMVHTPLAVAAQLAAEGRRFGIEATVVREAHEVTPGINITNYDRLHKFDASIFGGVVLDECFAADTLIDCDGSQKAIKDIRKGDRIKNASGTDTVASVHRREVPYGVKVKFEGQHFIASPNHPIFTQRGWVGARHLQPGDHALETGAAVSLVRSRLRPRVLCNESAAVLRDILLSEMADEYAGAQGEGSYTQDVRQDSRGRASMVGCERPIGTGCAVADCSNEPDDRSGHERETLPHIEDHEARTFRAWGQWPWAHGSTGIHAGCAWARMESGICFVVGPTDTGLSDSLQAGSGASSAVDLHRNGWALASVEARAGCEEGRETGFARVDGVEILELGHPDLARFRDADGKLYFYDIEATRHPSFSVSGLLVHNSGCIKHHDTKTFHALNTAYHDTPFKLPASATPAPNDWTELGTHAEFLGICTRAEMLAEFFTHDGGDTTSVWRLKGHARHVFWRWVASWGAMIRKPSDLGFDDTAYKLPPLHLHEHQVDYEMPLNGMLFATEAQTLSERREARKASMADRVSACVSLVFAEWGRDGLEAGTRAGAQGARSGRPATEGETNSVGERQPGAEQGVARGVHEGLLRSVPGEVQSAITGATRAAQCREAAGSDCISIEPWVIWCELNAEQDELERAFGGLAFSIRGADTTEEKEDRIQRWLKGERPVVISKASILGWGLNMQRAARMAFVGVTDSYEAFYQAVRREWRFGQKRDVHVHVFASKAEGAVVANLRRKEREAKAMGEALSAETRDAVMSEVTGASRETNIHNAGQRVAVPSFLMRAA